MISLLINKHVVGGCQASTVVDIVGTKVNKELFSTLNEL